MACGQVIFWRMGFAITGVLVGLSAALVFGIKFSNGHCAAWALLSGVLAGATFFLHIEWKRNNWEVLPSQVLLACKVIGLIFGIGSVIAAVVYIAVAIAKNQELTPYYDGFFLTSIWCLLSLKWAVALLAYAFIYDRALKSNAFIDSSPKDEF